MSGTQSYRRQHGELLSLAGKIEPFLNERDARDNALEIYALLSELIGRLNIHLTMEDKALYPDMMKCSNEEMRLMAARFSHEMGSLRVIVKDFSVKWDADNIQKSPEDFCSEFSRVFSALSKRIEAENTVLYQLYDKVS